VSTVAQPGRPALARSQRCPRTVRDAATRIPDLHAVIHDQAADGDKVWTRKTFHGTHGADFMGAPASGRAVTFDVIDVVRVRDGKMVEHWNVVDALTLMQQLGAAPVPS
jgi:predicted ester cyclase